MLPYMNFIARNLNITHMSEALTEREVMLLTFSPLVCMYSRWKVCVFNQVKWLNTSCLEGLYTRMRYYRGKDPIRHNMVLC